MIFSGLMLFILSTVVLALFFNRLQIREAAETTPTRRIQDLVTLLKQAEEKRVTLESEVSHLRKSLLKSPRNHASLYGEMSKDPELQSLYKLAGFTPIKGEGIVITLQDSKNPAAAKDPHSDPNAGKLQADDILRLINELKAAGATAISINDQRLVATSEIVAAGPTISVNQTRLTQPVVVKAIGDPTVMTNALKLRGGVLEYLEFFEIQVSVDKQNGVSVPAYKGPITE